jgi:hypothetical protein
MKRQFILGMGAGQCGTQLLAQILQRQPNTRVTHEQPPLLPWVREPGAPGIRERLERIGDTRRERFVGDVASFYLPYVEEAIEFDPEIRIVCLKRPRDEVVAGFCRHLDRSSPYSLNHWAAEPAEGWTHDFLWTRIFPKYQGLDRAAGIARYWDEYYQRVEELLARFPDNLRLWDTELLTTEDGVRQLLSFVGTPRGDQVLVTGQRPELPPHDPLHLRPEPRGPRYSHPLDPRKCVILVPFQGFIHQECDDALKELERRGYQVRRVAGYAAIDQGRNQLATDALIEGFEETLWIDSDVGFHPDAVDQLRAHPHPMVCGVYPQKGKRALACHVMPGQPSMTFGKRGGLVEMLYAGTGFLLIRREVYLTVMERLKLPVCNERFDRPTIPFFLPMVRPIEEGYWYLAEDYAFCERARQCGFRILADTSIRLWHIGYYRYGWEDAGLERQRFGTFTLNFGDAFSASHATQTERAKALEIFAEEYAWPEKKPEPPPFPRRNWLFPDTQQMLTHTVPNTARVIVELGSWTGQSTRFLASLAPRATVIAIDHWRGSPEHQDDAELAGHLDDLYETFLAESWNYRDQIIPVRASSVEGLERVAEAGLPVDLVYIDADHSYESVKQDLTTALDLFPEARIAGDDFNWDSVRQAVEEVARLRGLQFEAHGPAWRILPNGAPHSSS